MLLFLDNRQVDAESIVVESIDPKDYPDFSDAFVATAFFTDGGELSEAELDQLADSYPGHLNEWAFDRYLELMGE